MFHIKSTSKDYRFIRKVIRSIEHTKQIRACERLIDNWLNQVPKYERVITANRLRDFLIDTVLDKFPDYDYQPQ